MVKLKMVVSWYILSFVAFVCALVINDALQGYEVFSRILGIVVYVAAVETVVTLVGVSLKFVHMLQDPSKVITLVSKMKLDSVKAQVYAEKRQFGAFVWALALLALVIIAVSQNIGWVVIMAVASGLYLASLALIMDSKLALDLLYSQLITPEKDLPE